MRRAVFALLRQLSCNSKPGAAIAARLVESGGLSAASRSAAVAWPGAWAPRGFSAGAADGAGGSDSGGGGGSTEQQAQQSTAAWEAATHLSQEASVLADEGSLAEAKKVLTQGVLVG